MKKSKKTKKKQRQERKVTFARSEQQLLCSFRSLARSLARSLTWMLAEKLASYFGREGNAENAIKPGQSEHQMVARLMSTGDRAGDGVGDDAEEIRRVEEVQLLYGAL